MNKKQRKRKKKQAQAERREQSALVLLRNAEGSQNLETREPEKPTDDPGNQKPQSRIERIKAWCSRDKSFTDWTIAGFTAVLGILAIIQGVILHNQLREMRNDERAWINIQTGMGPIAEGKPLTAFIHMTNTGKTPAKKVLARVAILKLGNGETIDYTNYKPTDPFFQTAIGLLFPNAPYGDFTATKLTMEKQDQRDPPLLSHLDQEDLSTGKAYLVVFGMVTFFDINDNPNWVHFCSWRAQATGNYQAYDCTKFNDIDND